jgi:muramoyltetrapeptide carboxypeptidase
MIAPKPLSKGSKIAIVATARFISESDIECSLQYLRDNGFEPVYDERLFAVSDQFAGNDDFRANVLQSYLDSPDIDAILCARGGYGTIRIVDKLKFDNFINKPKWIIGYSDVTVLHAKLQSIGFESIHASMPINFRDNTEAALTSLIDALSSQNLHYEIKNSPLNIQGEAEAEIVGGNISVLYSMLGSSIFPNTKGKILFLEDLDEYLYHIDRMMFAFERAGILDGIKGLIVGGLTKMHDNNIPFGKTAEEIILERVADKGIPVCFNFPAGHIDDNRAIILGRKIRLSIRNAQCIMYNV